MTPEPPSERKRIREALRGAQPCPPVEKLEAHAGDPAVQSHLESCPRCQAELRLLAEFRKAEPGGQESADAAWIEQRLAQREKEIFRPTPARPSEPVPWWKSLLSPAFMRGTSMAVAALVLVAGLSFVLRRGAGPDPGPPVYEPGGPLRSASIELTGPLGRIANPPSQFQWKPVAGAARYEVRVLAVDRSEVWRAASSAPSIPVPEDAGRRIARRKTLHWEVVAYDGRDSILARSGEKEFSLP